jgi:hypothetical protein
MRGMDKYAKMVVSPFFGAALGYLFASQLDTDRFAMKMIAMGVLTFSFSITIHSLCERMFPSDD